MKLRFLTEVRLCSLMSMEHRSDGFFTPCNRIYKSISINSVIGLTQLLSNSNLQCIQIHAVHEQDAYGLGRGHLGLTSAQFRHRSHMDHAIVYLHYLPFSSHHTS